MFLLFLQLVMALTHLPIGSQSFQDTPAFNGVDISWENGSLPPPYHREHRIVVSATSSYATIRDYAEQLARVEFTVTPEQFSQLQEVVRASKIWVGDRREADGCVGGSSLTLTLLLDGEAVRSGERYSCGGQYYGTLYGDVSAVQQALQALVPRSEEYEAAAGE